MCGCEPSFVCSRCAGDLKQDYRLLLEPDPAELREEEKYADLFSPVAVRAGITKDGR